MTKAVCHISEILLFTVGSILKCLHNVRKSDI